MNTKRQPVGELHKIAQRQVMSFVSPSVEYTCLCGVKGSLGELRSHIKEESSKSDG